MISTCGRQIRFIAAGLIAAFGPALAGAQVFRFTSPNPKVFGAYAAGVWGSPDLDGDGFGDVIIGAYFEDAGPAARAGRFYVYSGRTGAFIRELVSPAPVADGFLADSIVGIPDINGDGLAEILTADKGNNLPGNPAASGVAYVFDGATGAVIRTLASPNPEANGLFGDDCGYAPDTDGDGIIDLLVGAGPEDDGAGRAYLFSGADGSLLHTFMSPNEEAQGAFSSLLDGLEDVDGDDAGDIAIGAFNESRGPGLEHAGRAYVFSGAGGGLLHTLVSPEPEEDGFFGWQLHGVPDFTGDGIDDVAVGAFQEDAGAAIDAGRAHLYSGADGQWVRTLVSPKPQTEGWFAKSIFGTPDANGDGRGDVLIGAEFEDSANGEPMAGRAYLFSGRTGELIRAFDSPDPQTAGLFGFALASIPDETGGFGGALIGAVQESEPDDPVLSGRAWAFFSILGAEPRWIQYE